MSIEKIEYLKKQLENLDEDRKYVGFYDYNLLTSWIEEEKNEKIKLEDLEKFVGKPVFCLEIGDWGLVYEGYFKHYSTTTSGTLTFVTPDGKRQVLNIKKYSFYRKEVK